MMTLTGTAMLSYGKEPAKFMVRMLSSDPLSQSLERMGSRYPSLSSYTAAQLSGRAPLLVWTQRCVSGKDVCQAKPCNYAYCRTFRTPLHRLLCFHHSTGLPAHQMQHCSCSQASKKEEGKCRARLCFSRGPLLQRAGVAPRHLGGLLPVAGPDVVEAWSIRLHSMRNADKA